MASNPVMNLFIGELAVEKATSWYFYTSDTVYSQLVIAAKYKEVPELGRFLGRMAASELTDSGFFKDVQQIIPVPLSWRRRMKRGYNQSEWLARGIEDITKIPIQTTVLRRHTNNQTQTHLGHDKRWTNVQGIFSIRNPERVAGQKVLLVDDVITTGATLSACAEALTKAVPDIRLQIFSLAYTQQE